MCSSDLFFFHYFLLRFSSRHRYYSLSLPVYRSHSWWNCFISRARIYICTLLYLYLYLHIGAALSLNPLSFTFFFLLSFSPFVSQSNLCFFISYHFPLFILHIAVFVFEFCRFTLCFPFTYHCLNSFSLSFFFFCCFSCLRHVAYQRYY